MCPAEVVPMSAIAVMAAMPAVTPASSQRGLMSVGAMWLRMALSLKIPNCGLFPIAGGESDFLCGGRVGWLGLPVSDALAVFVEGRNS